MYSAIETIPAWQQGDVRQPTKPATIQQNLTRVSNLSNPIQMTSNSIPSPRRNQSLLNSLPISMDRAKNAPPEKITSNSIPSPRRNQRLLNSLSLSMDRAKNVSQGTITSAVVTSKSTPNSPWGKNIIGNIKCKSDAHAVLNSNTSERSPFGDRKAHDPTRLSGITTRHQIQRNPNKLGPIPNQPVLGSLMPSGYNQTRHFSGASHWQITTAPSGNLSSEPTRISTNMLEGQHIRPTGYTSYVPGKDGQSWKISPENRTSAKQIATNCSRRDSLEHYGKPRGPITSPRNSTVDSSKSMPLPKISPYGPISIANMGGPTRGQSSLMKSSKQKPGSPRYLSHSKRASSSTRNKNETSKNPFNSQMSGALINMKGNAKRTDSKKMANANAKPLSKTTKTSMQPQVNSFRKVKSQLQMTEPKPKSLHAKDDSLKGSQKGPQKSKVHKENAAHIAIGDEDSDEEIWSKTIFDQGHLIKSAERWVPHLLSDYQTLFPAVSPTCQSLPSVVTNQGDRQARVPRRVRAHPPKRASSPTNYLSRILGLGDSASFYGSPLWRPFQRRPSYQKLNDNNNNAHGAQPQGYTKSGIHVILEDLAEEQNIITESTTHKENTKLGQNSASVMKPCLDAMVSKVTSSQDLSLEDLRVNMKQHMHSQQHNGLPKADSNVLDDVRMDIVEQAVDDAISAVQAQRQAAALKVTSILADFLLVLMEQNKKQKKPQTSQSVISKFWESDI